MKYRVNHRNLPALFLFLVNTRGFVGTRSPADVTGQLRGPGMTGGSMLNGPNSPAVTCHDPVVSRGKYFYNYNKVFIFVCVHFDLVSHMSIEKSTFPKKSLSLLF